MLHEPIWICILKENYCIFTVLDIFTSTFSSVQLCSSGVMLRVPEPAGLGRSAGVLGGGGAGGSGMLFIYLFENMLILTKKVQQINIKDINIKFREHYSRILTHVWIVIYIESLSGYL